MPELDERTENTAQVDKFTRDPVDVRLHGEDSKTPLVSRALFVVAAVGALLAGREFMPEFSSVADARTPGRVFSMQAQASPSDFLEAARRIARNEQSALQDLTQANAQVRSHMLVFEGSVLDGAVRSGLLTTSDVVRIASLMAEKGLSPATVERDTRAQSSAAVVITLTQRTTAYVLNSAGASSGIGVNNLTDQGQVLGLTFNPEEGVMRAQTSAMRVDTSRNEYRLTPQYDSVPVKNLDFRNEHSHKGERMFNGAATASSDNFGPGGANVRLSQSSSSPLRSVITNGGDFKIEISPVQTMKVDFTP